MPDWLLNVEAAAVTITRMVQSVGRPVSIDAAIVVVRGQRIIRWWSGRDCRPLWLDAGQLLADLWRDQFEVDEESADEDEGEEWDDEFAVVIAPFSRQFPGLAPGSGATLTEQAVAQALAALPPARIGLATASRPADVLPLIGWDGAANRWDSALVIAAVLRWWEERLGARLLRVGFAEVELLVWRPPRTREAAQRLAAEQFAFCDECAGPGLHYVSSITEHLLTSPTWTFWWD